MRILMLLCALIIQQQAFAFNYVCLLPLSKKYVTLEMPEFFTTNQARGFDKIYDTSGWSKILSDENINTFGVEGGSALLGMPSSRRFNMPVARILTSIELLRISKGYSKAPADSYLEKVYKDTGALVDIIKHDCASPYDDTNLAGFSFFGSDARIKNEYGKYIVYILGGPYSAVGTAGLIVHEAHHRKKSGSGESKPHDATSLCASCDSSFEYMGANAHQLLFNLHYGLYSVNGNRYMRDEALGVARVLQTYRFKKMPNFNIPLQAPR